MADEHAIARYRHWYAKLLRLYSKPYYERFGEAMEQTFNDLLRERSEEGRGLFGCALWMFIETFTGIIRENIRFIFMQTMTRAREGSTIRYRAAVGVAVATVLLLTWMTLAVGTEDDNSGGLMYLGVLVLGIGAIIARLRPQGMVRALFATALAQALVAVIAMIAWKQYFELLMLNGFFIALWVGSALLFRHAADPWSETRGEERASGASREGVAE
jgi:hypothetical protein